MRPVKFWSGQTRRAALVGREDDKGRYMTYKILAGVVLALVVVVVVALEVRATGSYEHTFNASHDKVWASVERCGFDETLVGAKGLHSPIHQK